MLEDNALVGTELDVKDGIIESIGCSDNSYKRIDGEGDILLPGFIDMHIHGAGGFYADIRKLEKSLEQMSLFLESKGITSFQLAMAMDLDLLENINAVLHNNPVVSAHIIGIYTEGPFISKEKKGGLPLASIRDVDLRYLDRILSIRRNGKPLVTTMTVAPEIEGSDCVIRKLKECGVVAALGHSNAYYEDAEQYGKIHMTHLYNAMRDLDHKKAGLAALPFLSEEATYELICDTVHVDKAMLALTMKSLGSERMALISDGMSFCGMGKGEGEYLGKAIYSDGNACYYKDSGVLVGSCKLISDTARYLYNEKLVDIKGFSQITSENPARILSLEEIGKIEVGRKADLILVDRATLKVKRVFKA